MAMPEYPWRRHARLAKSVSDFIHQPVSLANACIGPRRPRAGQVAGGWVLFDVLQRSSLRAWDAKFAQQRQDVCLSGATFIEDESETRRRALPVELPPGSTFVRTSWIE